MGWYMPSFQVPEVFGEGSSKSRPGLLVVLSKYPPPSLQTVSVSLQGLGQVLRTDIWSWCDSRDCDNLCQEHPAS